MARITGVDDSTIERIARYHRYFTRARLDALAEAVGDLAEADAKRLEIRIEGLDGAPGQQ